MPHSFVSETISTANEWPRPFVGTNGLMEPEMAELTDLAKLVCGGVEIDHADPECELSQISIHLRTVIETVLAELGWLSEQSPARITLYGPFLVRTLLEVGVTALIGRIDPTRLLIVKRTQQHGEYNTKQPWNSAIRWQGDVLDEKVNELWSPKKQYKDMTKALFGDYYIDLYWNLALKKVVDCENTGGTWLAEIKGMSIEEFSTRRRVTISSLYSESSKGVHSEFVVPPGSLYDKLTISNLVSKIIQTLSELGLLINFLPHIAYRLDTSYAIELFNQIEEIEVMP